MLPYTSRHVSALEDDTHDAVIAYQSLEFLLRIHDSRLHREVQTGEVLESPDSEPCPTLAQVTTSAFGRGYTKIRAASLAHCCFAVVSFLHTLQSESLSIMLIHGLNP